VRPKSQLSYPSRFGKWIAGLWGNLFRPKTDRDSALKGKTLTRKEQKSGEERIRRRFDEWITEVLAREEPLAGIDRELMDELEERNGTGAHVMIGQGDDRYSTWSAMTALTQEVKLQGRAFRDLGRELAPLSGLGESMEKLIAAQADAHEHQLKQSVRSDVMKEFMGILFDTRERLIIGLRSAIEGQRSINTIEKAGWLKRWIIGNRPDMDKALGVIGSLQKGYRLGLERLDEAIGAYGIIEINCDGKSFDPKVMTAVDLEQRADIPDGTVLDVYQIGYMTDTEILRPARVKVSRKLEY